MTGIYYMVDHSVRLIQDQRKTLVTQFLGSQLGSVGCTSGGSDLCRESQVTRGAPFEVYRAGLAPATPVATLKAVCLGVPWIACCNVALS